MSNRSADYQAGYTDGKAAMMDELEGLVDRNLIAECETLLSIVKRLAASSPYIWDVWDESYCGCCKRIGYKESEIIHQEDCPYLRAVAYMESIQAEKP